MKLLNLHLIMGWEHQYFLFASWKLNLPLEIFNTNMKFLKQSIYEFNCRPFSLSNCTFVNLKNKWGLSLAIEIKLCAYILNPNFDYFCTPVVCNWITSPRAPKKEEEPCHKLVQYINRIPFIILIILHIKYKRQRQWTLD